MKILGIETSCDETAAAVVEDGTKILSNVVISQIDIFAEYGGVIPEVAARSHLEVMMPVVEKAIKDANCTWEDINVIAVTHAPGLLGSLLIGTLTARTLAILHDKPLYAVHHLKSHIYANWLGQERIENVYSRPSCDNGSKKSEARPVTTGERERVENKSFLSVPAFPLLALVISGGHTQILYMPTHNDFQIIGTTRDDAIGECFDKVAKILGLPYPGGPSIAKAAKNGDENKYKFPHPKIDGLDFSFSGLKTAVLRTVQKELGLPISHPSHDLKNHLTKQQVNDFAASFQKTAVDILLEKLAKAKEMYPDTKSIVFAGGVSANNLLRETANVWFGAFRSAAARELAREPHGDGRERRGDKPNIAVFFPSIKLSGDNGAMVAAAAYYEIQAGKEPTDPYKLNIYPRISIEE